MTAADAFIAANRFGLGPRPGELAEGRDLAPTTNLRAVLKSALRDHCGLAEAALEDRVFPDSRAAVALGGLVRAA